MLVSPSYNTFCRYMTGILQSKDSTEATSQRTIALRALPNSVGEKILRMWPCRHGTTSQPILNQYYICSGMNQFWTNLMAWSIRPPFRYGSHTYVHIRSHFGSAEPILNQKCLQGTCRRGKKKKQTNIHTKNQGGVHILGVNCPRSDPDIAHMGYYIDPRKLIYILTMCHWVWDLG